MKRFIVCVFVFLLLLSASAFADDIFMYLPDADDWGMSLTEFKDMSYNEYESCKVGKKDSLLLADLDIEGYTMDGYYIFENGKLSKISYILSGNEKRSKEELNQCYETLVESMTSFLDDPESKTNTVAEWQDDGSSIEIGKGKFENYTGSDNTSVAIVFKPIKQKKASSTPKTIKAQKKSKDSDKKNTSKSTVNVKIGDQTVTISKAFKKQMDDYEAFFDSYVDVMKNPNPLNAVDILLKYETTMKEFEDLEDDLSDAELAYYFEVQGRIAAKVSMFN